MFRAIEFAAIAALGLALVAFIAPQQVPLVAYKSLVVLLGGYLGYWADRWLFPYARPHTFDKHNAEDSYAPIFRTTMIRRAIIVAAFVLALAIAL